ncbi:hypothetical protein O3597_26165 [Verrucosispora sp. WMMA2044]|uniref:hypothetical protein n=1 Tax=Micromonospora TaxID=1873 RepID=UPI001F45524D|nr:MULTISPECIES: hypothetical protein [Micromonospora]WBB48524.1 hypothetical protein O3597_26165 [Verrucosispora sp. WMMA2044]
MNTDSQVDWAKLAPQLADVARRDRAWYLTIACELVAPGDRLAVDIACGPPACSPPSTSAYAPDPP